MTEPIAPASLRARWMEMAESATVQLGDVALIAAFVVNLKVVTESNEPGPALQEVRELLPVISTKLQVFAADPEDALCAELNEAWRDLYSLDAPEGSRPDLHDVLTSSGQTALDLARAVWRIYREKCPV